MDFIAGIYGKLIGAVILLIALIIGYSAWHHAVYKSGYDAAIAKVTEDNEAQKAADAKHQVAVAAKVAPIEQKAQAKLDDSNQKLPATIKYVQVLVHDNPTFAACVRPAALDVVRQTQREALRTESAAGPFPARSGTTQLPGFQPGPGKLAALHD